MITERQIIFVLIRQFNEEKLMVCIISDILKVAAYICWFLKFFIFQCQDVVTWLKVKFIQKVITTYPSVDASFSNLLLSAIITVVFINQH